MKSYQVIGYTSPDGYAVCPYCIHKENEQTILHPIFTDTECDSYPTCDYCHEIIETCLTEEGRKEQIEKAYPFQSFKTAIGIDCTKKLHNEFITWSLEQSIPLSELFESWSRYQYEGE